MTASSPSQPNADTRSLTKVNEENLLFSLLQAGKIDLAVYDQTQGMAILKRLPNKNIRVLKPPFAVKPMYPYLHKHHAELVPKLEHALREMKKDGTFQRITQETLHSFSLTE